jgi:hypothetical protein
MADQKKGIEEGQRSIASIDVDVLKEASSLSVIKFDASELELYATRLSKFLRDPGAAALRLCDCCINVT